MAEHHKASQSIADISVPKGNLEKQGLAETVKMFGRTCMADGFIVTAAVKAALGCSFAIPSKRLVPSEVAYYIPWRRLRTESALDCHWSKQLLIK